MAIFLSGDGTILPSRSARLRCGYNLELIWPVLHWGLVFNREVIGAAASFLKGDVPGGAVPAVEGAGTSRGACGRGKVDI